MHKRFYAIDLPRSVCSQLKMIADCTNFLFCFFLFFLFFPPSRDAFLLSSSSSSSSASSSSSSSLIAIKYINRGDYPEKFDYAVWKLDLFLCSDIKLPSTGKYHVKCIECNWTNDFGGTNPLANHAEAKHRDLHRVAEWIAAKKALAAEKREQKEDSDTKLIPGNEGQWPWWISSHCKEEARPAPPYQLLKQGIFISHPGLALTNDVANFILMDIIMLLFLKEKSFNSSWS